MRLSPPFAVLAIVAAALAVTAWLTPPPETQATIRISEATYMKLASWGIEHPDAEGRVLTVEQVIEEMTRNWGDAE